MVDRYTGHLSIGDQQQVKPAFGSLCIRQVTPGVVRRALSAIARSSGPGAAKTARTCLSGMLALAIQDGAAAVHPVRDSTANISTRKRAPRALTTRAEVGEYLDGFRKLVDADELIVACQSPTPEGWLQSVTLLAEAMETVRA